MVAAFCSYCLLYENHCIFCEILGSLSSLMYTVVQLYHYSGTIFSQEFENIPGYIIYSSTLYHNVPFFEISLSRHTCSQDVPSWPSLWLFSFRSSVFCSSSFLLCCLHSSISFVHLLILLCNPRLSCSPVDFPHQITHSIKHTFLDIVAQHLHIPTFTFDSAEFFFWNSCTFCRSACNFSRFHTGLSFWNFMTLLNLVQPVSCGQSQYLLHA